MTFVTINNNGNKTQYFHKFVTIRETCARETCVRKIQFLEFIVSHNFSRPAFLLTINYLKVSK